MADLYKIKMVIKKVIDKGIGARATGVGKIPLNQ